MNKITLALLVFAIASCRGPQDPTKNADQSELINQKVNDLRDVLINPTHDKIEKLVHEDLTYGHSSGTIEDKAAFENALLTGGDIISWDMSEKTTKVVGNTAWVRHELDGAVINKADTSNIHLKVMLVWVNDNGDWKLLARQAVK